MFTPNPIVGTGLHAIGGMSAATCYMPYPRIRKWSWGSFWLVQACFAWLIMPMIVGVITVPGFFRNLADAPPDVFCGAFLLGAVYGFGGMSFGLSIGKIGYSLTYTIAIGLSAIIGTLVPLVVYGGLVEYFTGPGSNIVLVGMVMSLAGVGLCGWAGFRKENYLTRGGNDRGQFNMSAGLVLAVIAGVLSAVFNISLEHGQPIADMAAARGAEHYEGNAKLVVSTSGCLLVNLTWFLVLGIRQKTLRELVPGRVVSGGQFMRNFGWSALAGSLWTMQFFFYGLGHVWMGNFQFVSWVLHMSMLIFFSYIVGVIMKEWKKVRPVTYLILILSLVILIASFVVMAWGSALGEQMLNS
jgi:L-rhamnose-H+ transport protein